MALRFGDLTGAALCVALATACGSARAPTNFGGSTSSSGSTSGASTSTSIDASSTSTGEPPPESQACGTNYPEEQCDLDWAARNNQACNWWVDDCGPEAACHFVDDGATACVTLAGAPRGLHEPCTDAQECEKQLHCAGGFCQPRCSCDEVRPHCPDSALSCAGPGAEMGPATCVIICDPTQPSCPEIAPICTTQVVPMCAADVLPLDIPLSEPCDPDSPVRCMPGTLCTTGAPACDHPMCCSPFCSTDDPSACTEHGPGFSCVPLEGTWFDPDCYENVGLCRNDT